MAEDEPLRLVTYVTVEGAKLYEIEPCTCGAPPTHCLVRHASVDPQNTRGQCAIHIRAYCDACSPAVVKSVIVPPRKRSLWQRMMGT